MNLQTFLAGANHHSTCAYWDVDGPGANEACTCGLARYWRIAALMPQGVADLMETTIDLAEVMIRVADEPAGVDAADVCERYQRQAHDVERVALNLPRWNAVRPDGNGPHQPR